MLRRLATLRKVAYAPFRIVSSVWLMTVTYLPGGCGNYLRYRYYRRRLKHCGTGVIFDQGAIINGASLISLGSNVHIDKYCIISTGKTLQGKVRRKQNASFAYGEGELVIGDDVHLAPGCFVAAHGGVEIASKCVLSSGVKLYSLSNTPIDPDDPNRIISLMPYAQAPFLASPIVLQRNVWLGLNVVVMPGVTVGENSFVVSNSLLIANIEPNSHVSGQPGRRVKERFASRKTISES
jgi:acetyltransferase-like isoleucine patch superfamily enzyme